MIAEEIFEKNQVLTLAKAKTLVGQKVVTTSPVYELNVPHVDEFRIAGIESTWDFAAKIEKDGYVNLQEYWKTFMSPSRIEDEKRRLALVSEEGEDMFSCDPHNTYFEEPTFSGSDSDRPVYYVLVED